VSVHSFGDVWPVLLVAGRAEVLLLMMVVGVLGGDAGT